MFELLFLLLPLAVMYGWYVGARHERRGFERQESSRAQKIVSGVRFLLANKKLKATEVLADLLHVDSENFDANLALAEVYRARGDVEKAIGIHRHLLGSSLPRIKLELAGYELAKDYIAVGMYDDALKLLQEPRYDDELRIKSLKLMIKTCQKLGDWDPALEIIRRNGPDLTEKYTSSYRAQFICEKAKESMGAGRIPEGEVYLRQALHADPRCSRAAIMLSELLCSRGDLEEASGIIAMIPDSSPGMAMIALPILRRCFRLPAENERYMEVLKLWLEKADSASLILEIASVLEQYNQQEAEKYVLQAIRHKPNLRLFERLTVYQLRSARDPSARESLSMLLNLVSTEIAMHKTYVCASCGFASKIMFWNCPSCGEWNSIQPVRGLDGD